MKIVAWVLKSFLVIGLLALGGCAKQSLSVSDYHDIVIQTLNKSQSQSTDLSPAGSGFAAMISLLIGDMDCMGDACINGLRFSHLKELADQDRPQIANYRGELCDEKKLRPPAQEAKAHQEICSALEGIFREMDAIRTTADAAQLLLRGSQAAPVSPAVQIALEGAATNLAKSQQRLTATVTSLQEITWLKPALLKVP
jgi:hypothetical protein